MSKKQVYIFLGAPGSGKGALSSACVKNLGWKQLSMGDECRKHRSAGTDIGKEIDFAIKSGKLVSDDVIIDMAGQWLKAEIVAASAVILDGFPRTVAQAEGLVSLLKNPELQDLELHISTLQVDDNEIIARLSSRMMCTNKACQAVYSTRYEQFKPKKDGICDLCQAELVGRDDDKPEAIRTRLSTYHHHAKALIDFYEQAGYSIHSINADQPADGVYADFLALSGFSV